MKRLRRLTLLSIAALAVLWLLACSDTSTSLGRFSKGRTLHLSVVEINRVPKVRYATIGHEDVNRHYMCSRTEHRS